MAAYLEPELSKLLSLIAAIQGHAVPVHRFGMMSTSKSGADLLGMSTTSKLIEMWNTAVPEGSAIILGGAPNRQNLPLIWLDETTKKALIIKGLLSNGNFSGEDIDGNKEELALKGSLLGSFIALRVSLDADLVEKPKTAKQWFFFAIQKRLWLFIEAIIATFVVSLLALGSSFYTMQVYDRVVPTQNYSTLIVLSVGTLIAILFELLMKLVRSKTVDKACKAIDEELSGIFFSKALDIRMDARPKMVGTFAAQIKNFEMVRNFMTSSTLFLMADAPFAIFFIIVIYIIGGPVAFVPLALLPVSFFLGFYAKWKISKLASSQMQDANEKNGLLIDAIDGIEAIKAMGAEWKMLDRWKKLTSKAADKEIEMRHASTITTSITQTIQQLSYVTLIGVGVYEINAGHITSGALMACSIISNRALAPISQIATLMAQWQSSKAALDGLEGIMRLPSDRDSKNRIIIPTSCQGKLGIENVSFNYGDKNDVLKKTNMHINPGEKIAIIGPVGSGKSTLVKILTGLYKPSEGRVFFDDVDMSHVAPEFLREHIGYLPQDVRLFSGTLRDNLIIGLPSPTDDQILAAAAKTGLDKIIQAHPKGLGIEISEGGRGLSGGQRQVVGLTRLILAKPKVIILDEPTASMDNDLEAFIMKGLFQSMPADTTVIIATHKLPLLSLVGRVTLINKGQILIDGPRDEVIQKISSLSSNVKNFDPTLKASRA